MPEVAARVPLALAAAVGCGALVAVQARVNAGLAESLDDPLLAALVSFLTGLVAVAAVVASRPAARRAARALRGVPWWWCLGGLGGASLVAAGAFAAPRIGVALLTVALVAGQTAGGLAVDRVGLGPGGRHELTGPRLAGTALCLAAVVLSVSGRAQSGARPLLLLAVVLAGFLISLQQALNGRVRRATGDAGVATLVNFTVGTSALTIAAGVVALTAGLPAAHWPEAGSWHLYTGGPLGATFVAVAAVIVRTLGVLRLGLAVIAGQLVGGIALDLLAPAAPGGLAVSTVLSAGLTFVAVAVSGRAPRSHQRGAGA